MVSLDCLQGLKVKPLKHQLKLLKFILRETNRGIIVYHSVGSGKTITSILIANCLIVKYPNKKVIVITPTSLVINYTKEMEKLLPEGKINNLDIYSYGVFINKIKVGSISLKDSILIVDEAHNFNAANSQRSRFLVKEAAKAFKVILLTASPVKNNPIEILNLLSMIYSVSPGKLEKFLLQALESLEQDNLNNMFKKLFECKVSFYKVNDTENYPSVTEAIKYFYMDLEYYSEYYKIQENVIQEVPDIYKNSKNLQYFINGIRRSVNVTSKVSPKIDWIVRRTKEAIHKNKKVLIYSAWKAAGIDLIKKELDKLKIKYSEVTGSLTKQERDLQVQRYNDEKSKVMLVTSAGSEGLNLKATRYVYILDPYWNKSRIDQIIGRATRLHSHTHLSPKDRNVKVYHLLLLKPKNMLPERPRGIMGLDTLPSADKLLFDMSYSKDLIINKFYNFLQKSSIEQNSNCK